MGSQCFLVRMGMRSVFPGQSGFFQGLVRGMRQRVIKGMVPGVFEMAVTIHAGTFFGGGFFYHLLFGKRMSW